MAGPVSALRRVGKSIADQVGRACAPRLPRIHRQEDCQR
jgi:hypothetical protein